MSDDEGALGDVVERDAGDFSDDEDMAEPDELDGSFVDPALFCA